MRMQFNTGMKMELGTEPEAKVQVEKPWPSCARCGGIMVLVTDLKSILKFINQERGPPAKMESEEVKCAA